MTARTFVGSCEDMCPERERQIRINYNVSIFERDHNNQPNQYAMIKEYRRAGADQEEPPSDELRTPRALEATMHYLVSNIMDDPRSNSSELALEWYDFLWDRLRAIRKDITQQNICDPHAASLVECCSRFHIHCCYAMNRIKNFDVYMNRRNLNDCLQMLRQMYNDMRALGLDCPGELEFQTYDTLLYLDDDPLHTNNLIKSSAYRSSSQMKFVSQIFSAYTTNDFFRFFKLMSRADYLTSCILTLYVNKMRVVGLKIIVAACTSKQTISYPVDLAIQTLGLDDVDNLREFVAGFGLEIQQDRHLIINKDQFSVIRNTNPSKLPLIRMRRLVESKTNGMAVGHLISSQRPNEINLMRPLQASIVNVSKPEFSPPPIFSRPFDISSNNSGTNTNKETFVVPLSERAPTKPLTHAQLPMRQVPIRQPPPRRSPIRQLPIVQQPKIPSPAKSAATVAASINESSFGFSNLNQEAASKAPILSGSATASSGITYASVAATASDVAVVKPVESSPALLRARSKPTTPLCLVGRPPRAKKQRDNLKRSNSATKSSSSSSMSNTSPPVRKIKRDFTSEMDLIRQSMDTEKTMHKKLIQVLDWLSSVTR